MDGKILHFGESPKEYARTTKKIINYVLQDFLAFVPQLQERAIILVFNFLVFF